MALCIESLAAAEERLPAFPGADGFGADAKGGRGGRVVRVTNLNRRGHGSFSWALNEVKEPRWVAALSAHHYRPIPTPTGDVAGLMMWARSNARLWAFCEAAESLFGICHDR